MSRQRAHRRKARSAVRRRTGDPKTDAERRGANAAKEAVLVPDNGHGVAKMARRGFPEAHRATDFRLLAKRPPEAAAIVTGVLQTRAFTNAA